MNGLIARDWLRELLYVAYETNKDITIKTYGKGKYGRWLAEVFVDGVNVNEELITEGLAEVYSK